MKNMKTTAGHQVTTPIRWKIGETMPDMQLKQEQTLWDMFLSAFNHTELWN